MLIAALSLGQAALANAISVEPAERKIYSGATIEDDFADDTVLVVLNKEATRKFKTYTPDDFSAVGCKSVENLTEFTEEIAKKQIRSEGKNEDDDKKASAESFRTILKLELRERGVENVLKAIRKLEKAKMCYTPDRIT